MKEKIEAILEMYSHSGRDSLIPILQEIQEQVGCLNEDIVVQVGKHLNIPTSKIYGLATFYNQFRFEKKGKYHIQACNGTSCRMNGSKWIIEYIEKNLKIKNGQTSRNGLFSLEVLSCMGACNLGPVISVNGEYYSQLTPEMLKSILDEFIIE
jgi:NADH-quinone oxidoreductase subunit E